MATETWIINETFDAYDANYDIDVSYTSGGRHFDQISFGEKSSTTYYALIYSYKDSDEISHEIFHTVMPLNSDNWSISGYRTIIFDSPVTDANLLNWLQTRAVKKSNVSFKRHYKNTILIGSGTIKFRRYSITPPLSISYALTNCTADSTNPTEIVAGKTYDFSFTADSGYEFTGSGTTSVSGGTIVAWDYPDSSDLTKITVAIEVTGNLTITQIASVALPQLATPQNVTADGTVVSWNEVENATSYAVLADGSEIGTVENNQTFDNCIIFTGESSDFTLSVTNKIWDGSIEYSTDKITWTEWDGSGISSSNQKLYLRGSGNTTFSSLEYDDDGMPYYLGLQFVLSERTGCSGNLNTLLEYTNPPIELSTDGCYADMFAQCTNLTMAPELPATTLASHCYEGMFRSCTNLMKAPELPATTLVDDCYAFMFQKCTSLTQAPELPATTLAFECYAYMFFECTKLTIAPELPATTLDGSCYLYMFYRCTSLKISTVQSDEYPTEWRIPSSGTISNTPGLWNTSMLTNTGGTFTSDPSINTTYYGAWTK